MTGLDGDERIRPQSSTSAARSYSRQRINGRQIPARMLTTANHRTTFNAAGRSPRSSDDLLQRLLDRRVEELVPRLLRLLRQHALATEQYFVRELAKRQAQGEGRDRQDRRAVERAAERRREIGIAHRLGPRGVERAADRLDSHGMDDQADDVVEMDPRHPLAPAADPA